MFYKFFVFLVISYSVIENHNLNQIESLELQIDSNAVMPSRIQNLKDEKEKYNGKLIFDAKDRISFDSIINKSHRLRKLKNIAIIANEDREIEEDGVYHFKEQSEKMDEEDEQITQKITKNLYRYDINTPDDSPADTDDTESKTTICDDDSTVNNEVEFDEIKYEDDYIYVHNGEICRYNEEEDCYELTGKKWDYAKEKIIS